MRASLLVVRASPGPFRRNGREQSEDRLHRQLERTVPVVFVQRSTAAERVRRGRPAGERPRGHESQRECRWGTEPAAPAESPSFRRIVTILLFCLVRRGRPSAELGVQNVHRPGEFVHRVPRAV